MVGRKMNNRVHGNMVLASMSFLVNRTVSATINSNKDIRLKIDQNIRAVSNDCISIID